MTNQIIASVLDALDEPVMIVGDSGTITIANKAASTLFGTDLIDLEFVRVVRQPSCIRCLDEVMAGAARVSTSFSMPVPVRTIYNITFARIEEPGKADGSIVISFSDVSHVAEAEQMRSDFVANVSHELRSPLTSLSGFIETLQGPAGKDEATKLRFLAIMQREADRMNRLIGDLLSLSRVEVDEHIRPTERIDLFTVLQQVVSQLQQLADKTGSTISLKSPIGPTTIAGDQDQLVQVFYNLIENSLKYGDPGAEVVVSFLSDEPAGVLANNHIGVAVQDFGAGIAEHHIVRLTERFYRVDDHRSREKGGTGLGLAIVKHIINRHRGRLEIASEVGKGSTFSVFFPPY